MGALVASTPPSNACPTPEVPLASRSEPSECVVSYRDVPDFACRPVCAIRKRRRFGRMAFGHICPTAQRTRHPGASHLRPGLTVSLGVRPGAPTNAPAKRLRSRRLVRRGAGIESLSRRQPRSAVSAVPEPEVRQSKDRRRYHCLGSSAELRAGAPNRTVSQCTYSVAGNERTHAYHRNPSHSDYGSESIRRYHQTRADVACEHTSDCSR